MISSQTIPSPMSKICCFGNEVRFPETPILLGFGKSASLHSRNKYQIGEGIGQSYAFLLDEHHIYGKILNFPKHHKTFRLVLQTPSSKGSFFENN